MPAAVSVVIIGNGFWGCAIALHLRPEHPDLRVLDSARPGAASPVAAGFVRGPDRRPPPAWWTPAHSQAADFFLRAPWCDFKEETITSAFHPEPRPRAQVLCVDVPRLLTQVVAEPHGAERLEFTGHGWTVHTDGGRHHARQVVIAAGVHTDELLRASGLPVTGVRALPGTALVAPGPLPGGLFSHAYRLPGDTRTRVITRSAWAGQVRAGDTREPETATDRWERAMETSPAREAQLERLQQLLDLPGARQLTGLRPTLPHIHVEQPAPGLIVATGAGRSGLATAGGVALRVQQLLAQASAPGGLQKANRVQFSRPSATS